MMNLDEGVKVVQIAKVRGSVSDGLQADEADEINEDEVPDPEDDYDENDEIEETGGSDESGDFEE